jgi:hypothetical protein
MRTFERKADPAPVEVEADPRGRGPSGEHIQMSRVFALQLKFSHLS